MDEDSYLLYVFTGIKRKVKSAANSLGHYLLGSYVKDLEKDKNDLEEEVKRLTTSNDKQQGIYRQDIGKKIAEKIEAEESVKRLNKENQGLVEQVDRLTTAESSLEERVSGLEKEAEKNEKALGVAKQIRERQAETTKELYSRLVMSERFVVEDIEKPVIFLDNNLKLVAVNKGFTKQFGYELSDLREKLDTLPELDSSEIDYNSKGVSIGSIVKNMHNLNKLNVLNEVFYPKSRDEYHYELCLYIRPGKERKKKFWSFRKTEERDILCMGYVKVAIHDKRFFGAAIEIRELSNSEKKKVSIDHVLSKDALVTADEHIDKVKAEEYIKILSSLYTKDPMPKRGEPEFKRILIFDFINTKKIDKEAIDLFNEMYKFSTYIRGNIKIKLANLNVDLRKQLSNAGMGADIVHGRIRKDVEYMKPDMPLPETS